MIHPQTTSTLSIHATAGAGASARAKALVTGAGILVLVIYGVLVAVFGFAAPMMVLTGVLALPAAALMVANARAGIVLFLVVAYFVMLLSRFGLPFPVGTVMDAALGLLLVGFIAQRKDAKNRVSLRAPVNVMILAWIGYNLLEVVNPAAASRAAWLYTVRSVALVGLACFVFQQGIRTTGFIKTILKLWIALCTVGALYALKQEFIGFAAFEMKWLKADPRLEGLYHIGSLWRKFSIFSDPVAFSYNMVAGSLLCFSLTTAPVQRWKKAVLIILGGLFLVAMLYSGTRGAYVLVPAAFLLFFILRFNRKVLLGGIVSAALFLALIFGPAFTPAIYRFQTAFRPSSDASFNVRSYNQKRIQPFILSHPIGGGLGSTGVWGERFSPNTYLAQFPPDSGYVRVAVEQGWVGLALFCAMMFVILRTGINNYFRLRNPFLKSVCLAMLMVVFALNVGNIPQEALVQFPLNIYFYLAVAIIVILPRLEDGQKARPPLSRMRVSSTRPILLHT